MNSHPLVDIVITTRNNAGILRENLQSLRKQSFGGYACFVADDCSTDGTPHMLRKEFPLVRIVSSSRSRGPAVHRNRAARLGSAPFIVFLDDDVVLAEDWLEEMLRLMSLSSSIGAAGSRLLFKSRPGIINSLGGYFRSDGMGADFFLNNPEKDIPARIHRPLRIVYACSAAMMVKRSLFFRLGGFDPAFFYLAEDFDLGLRVNAAGFLVLYNPRARACHHYHATARTIPAAKICYLSVRNSMMTIAKNFSPLMSARMLAAFMRGSRFRASFKTRALLWGALHYLHILRQRRRIARFRVTGEEEVFSLNGFLRNLCAETAAQTPPADVVPLPSSLRLIVRGVCRLLEMAFRRRRRCRYADNLILLVTNQCNVSCVHCFLRGRLNENTGSNLSLEEIEKFAKSLGRVNNVVLGGGEPFLRRDLADICAIAGKYQKPIMVTIPTNGFAAELIYEQVKRILEISRFTVKISLSIDGPPAIHDKIRQAPGLFSTVKKTYERLVSLYYMFYPRLALQINSVIFNDNYDCFDELRRIIETEFPLAAFSFEIIRGSYGSSCLRPINEGMYERLLSALDERNDPRCAAALKLHRIALETLRQKRRIVRCAAGSNFLVLDFDGNIYPCEMLPAFANIRGKGYDIRAVVSDRRWKELLTKIKKGDCHCTHMCFLAMSAPGSTTGRRLR